MSPARASAAAAAAARRASAAAASCRRPVASLTSVDGPQARRGVTSRARGPAPPRGARDAAMRELMAARDDKRADQLDAAATVATSYDFTTPLSIIRYPDPRLRAPNARVGFFDDSLARLARAMFDAMYGSPDDGVGLAAPQVGINLRLMVFNPEGDPAKTDDEVVLVNPRVISSGGPLRPYEEGCLSFPGIFGDVVRPSRIKIKAQRLDGSQFTTTLDGWPARIFQHEYDHLQGVLFVDRMDPAVRSDRADKRLATMEGEFEAANPGVEFVRGAVSVV